MKSKLLTILILIAACVSVAGADTIPSFTLEECINRALQYNAQAEMARNNERAAVYMKKEAFTKYFPEIAAAGFAIWANHDILQYNLLDIIELGIIKNGKSAGIQALQPIFMGGQIVNGNKLADVGVEVARLKREQTQNELRLAVETMYWKLVTLKATRETLSEAIAALDTLSNQVKVAVDAGLVLNNDALKVNVKRNTYKSEMVDLDNGIHLIRMLLGQYMGLGADGDVDVAGTIPTDIPDVPFDIFMDTRDALHNTTDYRLLQQNIEAKKLEKRMTVGSNLPAVAFGAGWYYHDFLKQNHNFGALQLAVTVPLSGWWGGSYDIKRKNLAITNAKLEMESASQELEINMRSKWDNLTSAHRKMQIESESVAQSAENLRLNRMYYEAGMSVITDLLEAETELQQARERYISAWGNFSTARSAYLIATGR